MTISKSTKTYWGLVLTLAFFTGVSVFFLSSQLLPLQEMPAPTSLIALANIATVLIAYGGLGYLGLRLSHKIGFPDIWDEGVTNRQRFLVPAVVGVMVGLFFILVDLLAGQFHSLGALPHPDFPLSLVASITAAIGEEIIFRLFFIPFWLWLIAWVILKQRFFDQLFWIISLISAGLFAVGHIPSVMALLGLQSVAQIPPVILGEMFLLNGALSLAAAYYFRKYGFLAAVGIHFWTDIVWHVIYGSIS